MRRARATGRLAAAPATGRRAAAPAEAPAKGRPAGGAAEGPTGGPAGAPGAGGDQPLRVRRARRADAPELVRVCMSSFRGTATAENWTRFFTKNTHLPSSRVLVAEREGRILGTASLLDFRMAVEGRPCPVDGVAAVAVDPVARRQGVADALMREAVLDARERGAPLSALYAFRSSYYRRFGYAPIETGHALQVRPRDLPDSPERRNVRTYRDSDRPEIERCYRASVDGRTGPLLRSPLWWERRVLRDGQDRVVYVAPSGGRVEGYALCALAEAAPLGHRKLRVQELVARTTRAFRGLIGWLASLSDEFASIEISVPSDRSWVPFLRDPYHAGPRLPSQLEAAGVVGWGCMARITHLERALAVRPGRGAMGAVTLEIEDPLIAAHREPVTVRFGGARAEVRPGARSRLVARCGIDVLTQVWMGAVAASHARRFGMLESGEEAARLLDAAWFGPAPFLGTLNEF